MKMKFASIYSEFDLKLFFYMKSCHMDFTILSKNFSSKPFL